MKKSALITALFSFLLLGPCPLFAAESAPRVVVSIKPIHALVAGVMQGVGEPQLLVAGSGSPHGYSLRPSEARMLAAADLVVWVGPELEGFLSKPLTTLGPNARQLELMKVLKAQLLPLRSGGRWAAHDHDGHEESADEHQAQGQKAMNPHLWLSPVIAQQIVALTAEVLGVMDPGHRKTYEQNSANLHQRLAALHQQISAKLAPVKDVPYVVFHDAYPYFEAAYGLNARGSISIDAERGPGARRMNEIRTAIKELGVRCVFSEPQFEPRLIAGMIAGTGARTGVLDPLGSALEAGTESYFQLLNQLADNLLAGLR
jgi:zinc transport system substrate-binding protein